METAPFVQGAIARARLCPLSGEVWTRRRSSRKARIGWRLLIAPSLRWLRRGPAIAGGIFAALPARLRTAVLWETGEEAWRAWRTRDADRLAQFYAPDCVVEFSGIEGWPDSAVYRGHEGVHAMVHDFTSAWSSVHVETRSLSAVGNRYLGHIVVEGKGLDSGIEVTIDVWQVTDLEGGLVRRLAQFSDKSKALAEIGLKPNAAPALP